ncbi:MAG: ERAP1-like C-terminal domain-containing protein, partial [bacterium]|nr:ERAP1-like C-terminal domain-containing protein [bacterium]
GLVTFRENALLIDPANSSSGAKQRVAEVVAHELAHMWFGDLVTMKWWTNLWLNEGFATAKEVFALSKLFPEWDIPTQFVSGEYASALSLDSLRSSHPIEVVVNHPDEISQIFDAISYSKGASIIRMIHEFLGDKDFRAALHTYLSRHAYGNATTEDLWRALEEASGKPVATIMDTWTKQAGYPLISAERSGNTYTLTQQRFLASGEELTAEERAQTWAVPLAWEAYGESGVVGTGKLLALGTASVDVPPGSLFVKFNPGQVALVRVRYASEELAPIKNAIRAKSLSAVDRYGILSDALALTRAGKMSSSELLSLLSAYAEETDHTVWTSVLGALNAIADILTETPDEERFNAFARSLLRPIVDKLGWESLEGESHTTTLLRGMVLGASGSFGDHFTEAAAIKRFSEWHSNPDSLSPDLRAVVYGMGAKFGVQSTFKILTERYEASTLQEEKARLLNSLGKFDNPQLLSLSLDYAFSSGKVRSGDLMFALGSMGGRAKSRRIAWQFLKDNWEKVSERYSGGGLKMLARVISLTCDGFAQTKDADEIEAFFKEHPAPSATRAIAEAVERARIRARWYERDRAEISKALSDLS